MTVVAFLVLIIAFSVNHVWNMQVIPERAYVKSINEKYATGVKMYVRRYTRGGNYYLNLDGTTKQTWGDNVSVSFIFYEFLHNEYKRSFVEFEFKLCSLINKERYIGQGLIAVGATCPAPARHWALHNISVPTQNYPNLWPFEKCRLDVKIQTLPEKEHMVDLEVYLFIKQGMGK